VKHSNPALARVGQAAARERAVAYGPGSGPGYAPYPSAGYGAPAQPYPTTAGYPSAPPTVRPMTLDDVVVRTVGLLALTGVAGALAWVLVPDEIVAVPLFGAMLVGLVLGLVISFAGVTNPLVIGGYAVVEGVFVGLLSKLFEAWYPGIAVQAAVGTFGVFFLMAMLYKARVIRATPKFTRGVIAATLGIFALLMVNLVLSLFGIVTPIRQGGPLGIIISLVIIVVAALNFILDFAMVEEGVRYGMPQKYAWACSFGILVGLIWLYIEMLRLLSYLRGD
jgi:uncharacterized YccA/Bax inhibitor family protein